MSSGDEDPFGLSDLSGFKRKSSDIDQDLLKRPKLWNEEAPDGSSIVGLSQAQASDGPTREILIPYPDDYILVQEDFSVELHHQTQLSLGDLSCTTFSEYVDLVQSLQERGWKALAVGDQVLVVSNLYSKVQGITKAELGECLGRGSFGTVNDVLVGSERFAVKSIALSRQLPGECIIEHVLERESAMEIILSIQMHQLQEWIPEILRFTENDPAKRQQLIFALFCWTYCKDLKRYEGFVNMERFIDELKKLSVTNLSPKEMKFFQRLIFNFSSTIRSAASGDFGFDSSNMPQIFEQLDSYMAVAPDNIVSIVQQIVIAKAMTTQEIEQNLLEAIKHDFQHHELSDYLGVLNLPLAAWLTFDENVLYLRLLSQYYPNTLADFIQSSNDASSPHTYEPEQRWPKDTWYRDQICHMMHDICQAVAELHSAGIAHRDIKPQNILGEYEEDLTKGLLQISKIGGVERYDFETPIFPPRLSDFSVARQMRIPAFTDKQQSARESMGNYLSQSLGKVMYMAPEMKLGAYNEKVDVYSMGVLYLEMLLGSDRAFQAIQNFHCRKRLPTWFTSFFHAEHILIANMICDLPDNRWSARQCVEGLLKQFDALQPLYGERSYCDITVEYPFPFHNVIPMNLVEKLRYGMLDELGIEASDNAIDQALNDPFLTNMWNRVRTFNKETNVSVVIKLNESKDLREDGENPSRSQSSQQMRTITFSNY